MTAATAKDSVQQVQRLIGNLENLADYVDHARIGKALADLFDKVELLTIFHDKDDDSFILSASTADEKGTRKWSRQDLLEALEAAFSKEKTKRCAGKQCRKIKVMSQFSKDKQSGDGRSRYCKECEVKRVQEYRDRKKSEVKD